MAGGIHRKLGVSMNQVLLLDNRSMSYHFQKSNGVPIPDFFADRNDQEFLQGVYTNILRHASTLEDVRVGNFAKSVAGSLKNTSSHRYV